MDLVNRELRFKIGDLTVENIALRAEVERLTVENAEMRSLLPPEEPAPSSGD